MDRPNEEALTGKLPQDPQSLKFEPKRKPEENIHGTKMQSKSPKIQKLYPDLSDVKPAYTDLKEGYSTQENNDPPTQTPYLDKSDYLDPAESVHSHQPTEKPKINLKIEEAYDSWNLYFLGVFISLILSITSYYLYYQKSTGNQTASLLPLYLREIENLSSDYGHQTEQFWDTVKSFPYYLLSEEEQEGPAVLLMVAPTGSLPLALKLTKQLSKIINNLLQSNPNDFQVVNGAFLSVERPDIQKLKIDESIRHVVDTQRQRAVVITNLEKIDPTAVMIFHGYCDNTEAVYKNIAILFLLEIPIEADVKKSREVYDYLSKVWSPLGQTKIRALFTRMANNIAILEAE